MPRFVRAQLILIELAAALVLGGIALGGSWRIAGVASGAALVVLVLVPFRRRWLFQLVLSWTTMHRRRRGAARRPGLAGVLGEHHVESVPGGSHGNGLGVVRSGTTWSLPLALSLDGVFNDDSPVPVGLLAGLLQVEDVPLSSIRLLTLTTPARVSSQAPQGPAAPLTQLAARYLLITLDTRRAADAIAARGGTLAAVHQILRRCAVHAEQVLSTAAVPVRRLDATAVQSLFTTWLGPANEPSGRRSGQTVESWRDVRVAGTWSTVFALSGEGDDVADRVSRLAAAAPTPVVATALMLRSVGARKEIEATMFIRLSAPESTPHDDAASSLALLARAFDLVMQRLDGEQGLVLRATTPVGIGEPA